jgi:hypothetical protein
MSEISAFTFCNLTRSSTFQFLNSYISNDSIIAASFVEKGSQSAQGDRNVRGFNESFQTK